MDSGNFANSNVGNFKSIDDERLRGELDKYRKFSLLDQMKSRLEHIRFKYGIIIRAVFLIAFIAVQIASNILNNRRLQTSIGDSN